jgi:hypothetical protein
VSSVQSAKQLCEQALRNIGFYPVTDSGTDGSQLRQAMISLDLILGEEAGVDKLFFLIPATVSFTLTNGTPQYDLLDALGADAPVDGMQFPVKAYLLTPTGSSVVGISGTIPGTIAVGQSAADLTAGANMPPGATVAAIDLVTNQITLSGPSTIVAGDSLQFNGAVNLTATGTVNGANQVAGVSNVHREPIEIVTRDTFMASRRPEEIGRPRMVYVDRLPDNQLYLHPVSSPTDQALHILQLDVQTYAPNVAPAGVTGNLPQGAVLTNFRQAWQRFLVFQLSHDLGSGAISKLPETSLNRFGKIAESSRARLEAYENREHDTEPPICDAYDADMHGYDGDPGYVRVR